MTIRWSTHTLGTPLAQHYSEQKYDNSNGMFIEHVREPAAERLLFASPQSIANSNSIHI